MAAQDQHDVENFDNHDFDSVIASISSCFERLLSPTSSWCSGAERTAPGLVDWVKPAMKAEVGGNYFIGLIHIDWG